MRRRRLIIFALTALLVMAALCVLLHRCRRWDPVRIPRGEEVEFAGWCGSGERFAYVTHRPMATGGPPAKGTLWVVEGGKPRAVKLPASLSVLGACVRPSTSEVWLPQQTGEYAVVNFDAAATPQTWRLPGWRTDLPSPSLAWAPSGALACALGTRQGDVRRSELRCGKERLPLLLLPGPPPSGSWPRPSVSPDGTYVAVPSSLRGKDGGPTCAVYGVVTGALIATVAGSGMLEGAPIPWYGPEAVLTASVVGGSEGRVALRTEVSATSVRSGRKKHIIYVDGEITCASWCPDVSMLVMAEVGWRHQGVVLYSEHGVSMYRGGGTEEPIEQISWAPKGRGLLLKSRTQLCTMRQTVRTVAWLTKADRYAPQMVRILTPAPLPGNDETTTP